MLEFETMSEIQEHMLRVIKAQTSGQNAPIPNAPAIADDLPVQQAPEMVPLKKRNHFGEYLCEDGTAHIFWARGAKDKKDAEKRLKEVLGNGKVTKSPHFTLRFLGASKASSLDVQWLSSTFSQYTREEVVAGVKAH